MNLDLFIMNGYGLYVWSAFAFTLFNFLILYKVTSKQLIKEKAKPNKKEISKDEAEKILKQSQLQEYSHPNKDEKKVKDKKLSSNKTKPKSTKIKPSVKKSKKVSKK